MLRYFLFRLLWVVPALFLLAIICFFLTEKAPGDPVDLMLQQDALPSSGQGDAYVAYLEQYTHLARKQGVDLPLFYFSLDAISDIDTIHRILPISKRQAVKAWQNTHGNGRAIGIFLKHLAVFDHEVSRLDHPLSKSALNKIRAGCRNTDFQITHLAIETFRNDMPIDSLPEVIWTSHSRLHASAKTVMASTPGLKAYIPAFRWHGLNNQFHKWFARAIVFKFGRSLIDGRYVTQKVGTAFGWTVLLNLTACILALIFSLWAGWYLVQSHRKWLKRALETAVFLSFSIPIFWLATWLLLLFTTPHYLPALDILPSIGVGHVPRGAGWTTTFSIRFVHLLLPVICLTIPYVAYLTKVWQQQLEQTQILPFVDAARAKGLSKKGIWRRHIFPNSLLPIVTLFGTLIPAIFGGSVVIEVLFHIPGIGALLVDSIFARDWPVVYAIVWIIGSVTIGSYILVDFVYGLLDPKIRTAFS